MTHHPDASTSSHDLREAVARQIRNWASRFGGLRSWSSLADTLLTSGPIASELDRLTGERDEADRKMSRWRDMADECAQDANKQAIRALAAEAELATLKAAAARDAEERVRLTVAAREYQSASGYLIGQYIRLHEGKPSHDLPEAHAWSASAADALADALTNPEKNDG
jgi:hypothetical protein